MRTKLFCWNVRGVNIYSHRSGFRKRFKGKQPLFGGLIETHVKQPKMKKFMNGILPGWNFYENYGFSELGKIWIMWYPSVKVVVLFKSLQMVMCQVLLPDSMDWIFDSVIYAANEEVLRQQLWADLKGLNSSQGLAAKAWIVLGDFNQVLNPSEHSAAPNLNVNKRTRDFQECLLDSDLSDLTFRKNSFTWWNKSKSRPVAEKLDRVLVNFHWGSVFPEAFAFFEEPDFSDHASCSVSLSSRSNKAKKTFRFYNFLLQNEEFLSVVTNHWYSMNVSGSAMLRLSLKLKGLKNIIRKFSKENYSNLEKRVSEAHEALLLCQNRTLANLNTSNAEQELEAERKWKILQSAEESFFCQRSRISWLGDGDSSTTFFHRMADSRKAQNHIHYLLNADNVKIDYDQEIRVHCVDFFSDLLGGAGPSSVLIQSDMELLLPFRCSVNQKTLLEKKFSSVKIRCFFLSPK